MICSCRTNYQPDLRLEKTLLQKNLLEGYRCYKRQEKIQVQLQEGLTFNFRLRRVPQGRESTIPQRITPFHIILSFILPKMIKKRTITPLTRITGNSSCS